ncbi:MAG: tRNA (guanosine(37)-N1)-methyltransferase TrmD [Erysipelothrix sp.]|nr:tRNA (guanosine(37)-N1)-methyltransferase TrmD [Erysipelothrix sp.]
MKITILTLFPEQFVGFIETSIINKAIKRNLVSIETVDIRSFSLDKHHRVDDKPYGGGAGLVMRAQPILDALRSVKTSDSHTIYLSASGSVYKQAKAQQFSTYSHLILLCGHYEGIDERVLDEVDEEICIGDYVLTGGELAAMVISDSVIRLLDDVITKESLDEESFENNLLEYPHYTTPAIYEGKEVPLVLQSGHHKNIRKYRLKESLRKTLKVRPDLFAKKKLTKEETQLLEEIQAEEVL